MNRLVKQDSPVKEFGPPPCRSPEIFGVPVPPEDGTYMGYLAKAPLPKAFLVLLQPVCPVGVQLQAVILYPCSNQLAFSRLQH